MFIKVSGDDTRPVFVNSDCVRKIILREDKAALIFVSTSDGDDDNMIISRAAAEYFLVSVEAQSAQSDHAPAPAPLSLKSRIAIALREDFPEGAIFSQLSTTKDSIAEIAAALDALLSEGVIKQTPLSRYYHASHAPKQTLDPSTASADLSSVRSESNER